MTTPFDARATPLRPHELPPTGNTEFTQPENRAFYPALDGLRAVAFLMVFGQHYLALAWGWTGVNLFFVLSGFLITGILYDTRNDLFRARNFYLRRTLRIFPLYYGVFFLLLLLAPAVHWNWNRYWLAWPLYLGNFLRFLSPSSAVYGSPLELAADAHLAAGRWLPHADLYLGHFWSLCVEEQFYLLWPWVVFWVKDRRRLIQFCVGYVVFGIALRFYLQAQAPGWMLSAELLYRFTPAQFDALLLGGLAALLWRGPHRAQLLRVAQVLAGAGTLLAAWYLLVVVHHLRLSTPQYPAWRLTLGLPFVNFYGAALIVCALRSGSLAFRLLHLRPLRWLGRLSYGAYVYHDILHNFYIHIAVKLLRTLGPRALHYQTPLTAILALPSTLILASLSFRFFEAPFLNLKDRWTLRTPRRAEARSLQPAV